MQVCNDVHFLQNEVEISAHHIFGVFFILKVYQPWEKDAYCKNSSIRHIATCTSLRSFFFAICPGRSSGGGGGGGGGGEWLQLLFGSGGPFGGARLCTCIQNKVVIACFAESILVSQQMSTGFDKNMFIPSPLCDKV